LGEQDPFFKKGLAFVKKLFCLPDALIFKSKSFFVYFLFKGTGEGEEGSQSRTKALFFKSKSFFACFLLLSFQSKSFFAYFFHEKSRG
jgi:hypothetical protein